MYEWHKQIQIIVDEIDECIKRRDDESLTLQSLSFKLGYSEFHTTRKFKEISGMQFRDYLRHRRLAFALKEMRDSERSILDIAFDYGFSSHEAFTRAFKTTYGITPSEYRKKPVNIVVRTKINPFNRHYLGIGEISMLKSTDGITIYITTIPAHKLMYVENKESNAFWDFVEKQNALPGQDFDTICDLLHGIEGCLDGKRLTEQGEQGNHYIMAHVNDANEPPNTAMCFYNCVGIRLDADYDSNIPSIMRVIDVPEAEYIVFEHGPFDYNHENLSVEAKIDKAIASFDFSDTSYCFDASPGRTGYFYHVPSEFWKYIKPVRKHN